MQQAPKQTTGEPSQQYISSSEQDSPSFAQPQIRELMLQALAQQSVEETHVSPSGRQVAPPPPLLAVQTPSTHVSVSTLQALKQAPQ